MSPRNMSRPRDRAYIEQQLDSELLDQLQKRIKGVTSIDS